MKNNYLKPRILRNFAEFSGILRNFAEFSGIWQNFAEFCGILRNFAEFCGTSRSFSEYCGDLRNFAEFCGTRMLASLASSLWILMPKIKIQNWRFGTVCADLESSSFSLNFCNVL